MRRHLRVTGIVQGVGFRPFVHRLARDLSLSGFVGNDAGGVFVEIEGPEEDLDAFESRIRTDAPPASRITGVRSQPREVRGEPGFAIVPSRDLAGARTLVSPDLGVCAACRAEVLDPSNRRHRYAFTNCTDCGPRFTIIRGLPYDRPRTTMADFSMCPACRAEYDDVRDRRHHAQPNACPSCGPKLYVERAAAGGWESEPSDEPAPDSGPVIRRIVSELARGGIVALEGLGGFHLACDATRPDVVGRLRARKHRPTRPLALMVAGPAHADALCRLDSAARTLLGSVARPIVLSPWRSGATLEGVAPRNGDVGIMLPYTPLHELLLRDWARHVGEAGGSRVAALVMTSANRSGEPMVIEPALARERLAGIADLLVTHDRPIHVRADDSVMTTMAGGPVPLRRSRGYAPFPVELPVEVRPTLGVGGELKSTFCLAAGSTGFLSQHIGDMENRDTLLAFETAVDHFRSLFGVEPETVVCDRHPGYLSSDWARRRWPGRTVAVQHHHAHVASLMGEHGLGGESPLLGVAFDGTGWGPGDVVWGGEFLLADYRAARRVAHLAEVPLPGGEAAVLRPYRHALSLLAAAGVPWTDDLAPLRMCRPAEAGVVAHQIRTGLGSPRTSSMGRLFDAVAALLGLAPEVTFEGELAIALEALAREVPDAEPYAFRVDRAGADAPWVLDPGPVVEAVVHDVRRGRPHAEVARAFHGAVADGVRDVCRACRRESTPESGEGLPVGLTGGVFQNRTLTERLVADFEAEGVPVLLHRTVPPNDGGLALGQVLLGEAGLP